MICVVILFFNVSDQYCENTSGKRFKAMILVAAPKIYYVIIVTVIDKLSHSRYFDSELAPSIVSRFQNKLSELVRKIQLKKDKREAQDYDQASLGGTGTIVNINIENNDLHLIHKHVHKHREKNQRC